MVFTPNVIVQKAVESFGEGVEETPDSAALKILMTRFSPFMANGGDGSVWHYANVAGPDDEIRLFPIRADALDENRFCPKTEVEKDRRAFPSSWTL